MKQTLRKIITGGLLLALMLSLAPFQTQTALAVSSDIVISQVYGGGGNAGAPYTNDFIELFNRGTATVSLTGLSVQYASATGTGNFSSNPVTILSGSLAPGQYYLIQQSGGTNGIPLPTPDVTGTVNMSGTSGKIALVLSTSGLSCNGGSTPCSASQLSLIKDLVGYGTANFFEGAAAPAFSNTTSGFRAGNGCTDTDYNSVDFTAGEPTPRNSVSPLNPCPLTLSMTINDVSANEGNAGTTSFDFTVSLSALAGPSGVTFDIATQDNTATVSDNDYVSNSLTGQVIPGGSSTYTFSVLVNGDIVTEPNESFFVNVTNVVGADVVDGQGQGTIVNDDVCDLPYTPIYQIQGYGLSASITGNVTTKGVVVGDFEGSASASGFYLQDLTGDGDPTTSDGIFIYTGSSNLVSVGQVVRVTGYARERFNQTTINGSNSNSAAVTTANIVQCGTGSVTPIDISLPFGNSDFPERFEGMLVRFPQSLVISEYFNYDRFGEIVLALPLDGETRAFTGTAIDEPGAAANARTLANSLRRITLDDAQSAQNPSMLRHPNGAPFALNNSFRGGDTVQNAVGILGYDFNLYRIIPTGPADYTAANPRPSAPEPVGGSLRVAAMNTLNFFVTADYPTGNSLDNKCGPLNDVECRGWDFDQPLEFTRQRDKLIAALTGLDADIIGLNELENTTGVEPLAAIVASLPGYAYINTGTIGTDAIKVGLIYRTAKVVPVGSFQILNSSVDPRFIDTKSRPSLAQTFQDLTTGGRFTVVVNHLKSKGSDCNDVGDPDLGDGQGNCSQTRRKAAQALVDWLATDPTGSGDPDFIILGDLNSYAQEDTIDEIKAGADGIAGTTDDFTNLIAHFQGNYAYSYVFDGQAGYLDHALASASMLAQVTGATDWHINADEPDVLDYDTSFKPPAQDALYEPLGYRSSDHDPVIVGLNLVNHSPVLGSITVSPSLVAVGDSVAANVSFTDQDILDTHTAIWNWGDGNETMGTVSESSGAGTVTGSHSYGAQGFYTVKVTVMDGFNTVTATYESVIVYEPNGKTLTGGGWFTSSEGKAEFMFDAKYKKGASVPTGEFTLTIEGTAFSFYSSTFDWLVFVGSAAYLKGTAGDYEFLLVAEDGNPDTVNVRIWNSSGDLFSSQGAQSLGGGRIQIHK